MTLRRCSWLLAAALALAPVQAARAVDTILWVSPGIKLAYTFGVGFTFGLEVSLVWAPATWEDMKKMPLGPGFVIDLDSDFDEIFRMRVGAQVTELFFGLETGPGLVVDKNGSHFGYSLTLWASSYVIPYYTFTYVSGESPNLHDLGVYLKLHLDSNGDFGNHHHFDDD